jgi:hypothetical protein
LVTVNKLQHLWQQLAHGSPGAESGSSSTSGLTLVDAVDEGLGGKWKLWGLLTRKGGSDAPAESENPVKGLYLYGGVGSGKTMLMDLFYDTLPPSVRKKRVRRPRQSAQNATRPYSLTGPSAGALPRLHAGRPPPLEGAEGHGRPAASCGRGEGNTLTCCGRGDPFVLTP